MGRKLPDMSSLFEHGLGRQNPSSPTTAPQHHYLDLFWVSGSVVWLEDDMKVLEKVLPKKLMGIVGDCGKPCSIPSHHSLKLINAQM